MSAPCIAYITSTINCCRPETQLVDGVPLCATHRRTYRYFGKLRLAGGDWLELDQDDPDVPDAPTDPTLRARLDLLNLVPGFDGPPEVSTPKTWTFVEPEPIAKGAAVQADMFVALA